MFEPNSCGSSVYGRNVNTCLSAEHQWWNINLMQNRNYRREAAFLHTPRLPNAISSGNAWVSKLNRGEVTHRMPKGTVMLPPKSQFLVNLCLKPHVLCIYTAVLIFSVYSVIPTYGAQSSQDSIRSASSLPWFYIVSFIFGNLVSELLLGM
jgi:hypothetical protein